MEEWFAKLTSDKDYRNALMSDGEVWIIVTPVFKPAPGGGAIYTDILSRALVDKGYNVLVLTERYPGEPDNSEVYEKSGKVLQIRRIFPYRAGRAQKDWTSYLAYLRANISYFKLSSIIRSHLQKPGCGRARILVHSSLMYSFNLLEYLIGGLRLAGGPNARLYLDVRDPILPDKQLGILKKFDRVVTSSAGVAADLCSRSAESEKITSIPMPFERPTNPTEKEIRSTLSQYNLSEKKFLFNPNGIATRKHTHIIRDAIRVLRNDNRFRDVVQVTAGRDRDRTSQDSDAEKEGLSLYLGPIHQRDVLCLMKASLFTVILSKQEAISRAAVEALSVGGRVILPDIIEFQRDCASHTIKSLSAAELAKMVSELVDSPMPDFDFANHMAPSFVPLYVGLER